jgi:hypothetical protein
MTDTTADDSALACQVVEERSQTAISQLLGRYSPRLHERATKKLTRTPALARHGDADDLVQMFLLQKVLPPEKQGVMFAPVAGGRIPLWPRLCASFDNFLRSLLRRKALPMSAQPVGQEEDEYNPEDRSVEVMPVLRQRVADQFAAVRELPAPARGAVPYGAVLLLTERVRLAQQVADSYAPEDGRTVGNQGLREVVEDLAPWTPAEEATPLPPRGVELGAAWRQVCEQTEGRPQLAGPAAIARALGGNAAAWTQWLSRGRVHLVRRLGLARARELFPWWPPRSFERGAGAETEGEL